MIDISKGMTQAATHHTTALEPRSIVGSKEILASTGLLYEVGAISAEFPRAPAEASMCQQVATSTDRYGKKQPPRKARTNPSKKSRQMKGKHPLPFFPLSTYNFFFWVERVRLLEDVCGQENSTRNEVGNEKSIAAPVSDKR